MKRGERSKERQSSRDEEEAEKKEEPTTVGSSELFSMNSWIGSSSGDSSGDGDNE